MIHPFSFKFQLELGYNRQSTVNNIWKYVEPKEEE